MRISGILSNNTTRRAFAALALAAFAILAFRPVCDAYGLADAYHQGEAAEFCCSALGAVTLVPPATSAISAGDDRGALDLGILAALLPLAVPRRVRWPLVGASPPLALGS